MKQHVNRRQQYIALRVTIVTWALIGSLFGASQESATSTNWSRTTEQITIETTQTSSLSEQSQDEIGNYTRPGIRLSGRQRTTGKPTPGEYIETYTSPQHVTHSEHTTSPENYLISGGNRSDDMIHEENVSVSTTTENNTNFNQTIDSMKSGAGMWLKVLHHCQLFLSIVGYVANKITFITLVRNGDMFSPAICLLLKHQALVDSWICAMGIILLLQPPMWTTGNTYIDAAVCYLWHGQGLFWGAILLSVWNLATVAVDRYMAVCRPFNYGEIQGKFAYYSIAAMYVSNVFVILPSFIQVRFDNGVCYSEYLIQGTIGETVFFAYSLVWFFAVYALPVVAYVYLYGSVILALYRRRSSTIVNSSKVINSAQSTITKTAITLTGIFLFAIGFDAWAYVLGYTGVVEYEFGTGKQKIGVFFSVFNSIVNPFVYLALMPSFRVSLRKTFSCCIKDTVETCSSKELNKTSYSESSRISITNV